MVDNVSQAFEDPTPLFQLTNGRYILDEEILRL